MPPAKPPPSGHSRHLRRILEDRRTTRGLSTREVAELIAEDLELGSMSYQTVRYWETYKRHPAIDRYASWARVLGMRLRVDLVDEEDPRTMVLLRHQSTIDAARALDLLTPAQRAAVLAMVESMAPPMER